MEPTVKATPKTKAKTAPEKPTGLALLRAPFPANQISKLPKPTKRQTEEVRNDFKKGIRCKLCGAWHHPQVVHLDYVGHAALTDRLLDCDPEWNWEPVARNEDGTPKIDGNGGMWIYLTVCGVTRLGYGDAQGKNGGDAIKEVIGDALRNAAMRFGAALDLWHKGALHVPNGKDEDSDSKDKSAHATNENAGTQPPQTRETRKDEPSKEAINLAVRRLKSAENLDQLWDIWRDLPKELRAIAEVQKAKDDRKIALNDAPTQEAPPTADSPASDIPY